MAVSSTLNRPLVRGICRLWLIAVLALLGGGCGQTGFGDEEFSLMFGGDTGFGESYREAINSRGGESVLDHGDYDRYLAGVGPLMLGSDLVVLNLETPLTELRPSPLIGVKRYIHWSDPQKVPEALRRHNVAAVSLANNHTLDHKGRGLADTLRALSAAGIEGFGAGANPVEASRAFKGEVDVGGARFSFAVLAAFEVLPRYEDLYGFYATESRPGANALSVAQVGKQIARLRREDPEVFVILFPHWGPNYRSQTAGQQELGRRLIDAGADLVIGHGAHQLQGLERYRDRWILYGIGNFVFNSPGRYEKEGAPPFSLAVRLSVTAENGRLVRRIRCYPLVTDNLRTDYRTRPVTDDELEAATVALQAYAANLSPSLDQVATGRDAYGWYLEL